MGVRKRANGDGGYQIRTDGRYNVYYKDKHTTVKDLAAAKRKLRELKEKDARGEITTVKRMTVESYVRNWMELYKKPTLKPKSFKRLQQTFENQIIPHLGRLQVQAVMSDDIQLMINRIMSNKSYSTAKKAYDCINECFKQGVIKRELAFNPCVGVKLPKKPKKVVSEEFFCYSVEQVKQIIEAATSKNSKGNYIYRYGNVIVLLLYTGIREGEVLYLKWKDVDFDYRYIYIHGNVVDVDGELIEQDTPKTDKSNRKIRISLKAVEALQELKRTIGDDTRVVATAKHKVVNPSNIRRTMLNILNRCGDKSAADVKSKVHALRHTFATTLIRQGQDVKAVSEILGHSDITVTLNTYHHVIDEQKIVLLTY